MRQARISDIQGRGVMSLCLGFVLCVSILTPGVARAIPLAGDYVFTAGYSGTFHSTGSLLDAWQFIDPLGNPVNWESGDAAQTVLRNDTFVFAAHERSFDVDLDWGTGRGQAVNAAAETFLIFDVAWTAVTPGAVPEAPSSSLVALGLLALLSYRWRQRRQAGVPIG